MTHINVMVDNVFGQPVADALNQWGSIKARTVVEYGFKPNEDDAILIANLDELNCLLLTFDHNTINERKFPPCSHGGIIIVRDSFWTAESVFAMMKAFILTGRKALTAHCVTYLQPRRAVIHTHDVPVIVPLKT